MEKENLRFYVKVRYLLGKTATDIHEELSVALGDQAPSYAFVVKWIGFFKGGREDVKDAPRVGRPITEVTDENIAKVREVIEEDPYVTYDEIEVETSLSRGSISRIIHDCLKLKKIASVWVPHQLTEKNRLDRVAMCRENLSKFKGGKWRLCDVITGDESWFYHRRIGRKQSNYSWVGEGESARTVVDMNQKQCFLYYSNQQVRFVCHMWIKARP